MIVHLTSADSSKNIRDGTAILSDTSSLSEAMRISFEADGISVSYTHLVEYWLYLEGCDEQCFNPVQNKDAGLMLAFVGVDESQKGEAK